MPKILLWAYPPECLPDLFQQRLGQCAVVPCGGCIYQPTAHRAAARPCLATCSANYAGTAAWPRLLTCKDATLSQAAFGYNLALLAERDAELARCDAEAAAAAAAAAVAQQRALKLQAALAQAQAGANFGFILSCSCGPEPPLKSCFSFLFS